LPYATVTLTGTYTKADGTADSGKVYITPSTKPILDATGNTIIVGPLTVTLDANGHFSVTLPATDDATLNPTGFGYTLVAALRSGTLPEVSFALPAATATVDMADITPVDPSTFAPAATYVALAEKGSPSGVATLDAGGTVPDAQIPDLSSSYANGFRLGRFIARALAGNALKVVFIGDSITAGTGATLGVNDFATLVTNSLTSAFPLSAFTQSNRGVSGTTVATNAIGGTFASAMTDKPDLCMIMFGKNDSVADQFTVPVEGYPLPQAMRGLEVMIREVRRLNPQADIIIGGEFPSSAAAGGATANPKIQAFNVAAQAVADAYGCEFVDLYAAYVAQGDYSALLSDGVHPSVAGHALIAQTIMSHIPTTLRNKGTAPGQPGSDGGLYAVTEVATAIGYNGWSIVSATGGSDTGSWITSGTWTGPNPYTSSTAGDYAEFQFTGTECMIRVSCASSDAAVVDVTVDGVVTQTNLPLTTVPTTFQPFILFASGLSIESTHKVRLTVKSGTLRIWQGAWLTSNVQATDPHPAIRRLLSQRYYGTDPYLPTTSNPAAGTCSITPFWVPRASTFDQIAAEVTTAQPGASVRLGIYGSGAAGQPLGLIFDAGTIDASTTGIKTLAVTVVLQPGWHWLAALSLGAAASLRCNQMNHPMVAPSAANMQFAFTGYTATGLSALPAVWTSTSPGILSPRVLLRKL
jgi:lysophospholipase L1-like esterase